MHTFRKLPLLFFVITVAAAAFTATPEVGTRQQAQNKPAKGEPRKIDRAEVESQFPVADYDAPEPDDESKRGKRRAKSGRYDKRGVVPKPQDSGHDQGTVTFNDWEMSLPALPVAQSDLIVVGEVLKAAAHLSSDKSGVYSEFSVRADEVLMAADGASVAPGSVVTAEREGGRVRFPSGATELYQISGQGMPRVDHRYVLFLKQAADGQGYDILTGYELQGDRVLPLDKRYTSNSKFHAYKDKDVEEFRRILQDAVAHARQSQE